MTEPNYKEIAEKLYNMIKTIPYLRGYSQCNQVMEEYENLTRPRMIFNGYRSWETYRYNDRDYALVHGHWYRIQKCQLTLIDDIHFVEELNKARDLM